MGTIYNRATRVIAWLAFEGATSSIEDRAFEDEIASAFPFIGLYGKEAKDSIAGTVSLISSTINEQGSLGYLKAGRDACRTTLKLFKQTYWTRLWIIQEIVLARRILVCFNSHQLEWDDLVHFCFFPPNLGSGNSGNLSSYSVLCRLKDTTASNILEHRGATSPLAPIDSASNDFGSSTVKNYHRTLFGLFERYGSSSCADIRDKVFGLRSLSLPCCQSSLPVDYSKSGAKIYASLLNHSFSPHRHEMMAVSKQSRKFYHKLREGSMLFGFDNVLPNIGPLNQLERPILPYIGMNSVVGLECRAVGLWTWMNGRDFGNVVVEEEVLLERVDGSLCTKTGFLEMNKWEQGSSQQKRGSNGVLFQINNLEFLLVPHRYPSQIQRIVSEDPKKGGALEQWSRRGWNRRETPMWLNDPTFKGVCQLAFTTCFWCPLAEVSRFMPDLKSSMVNEPRDSGHLKQVEGVWPTPEILSFVKRFILSRG
ncbi:uncharacterized protein LY89DRAFT_788483 [Mollisia scopiformis]|uniref:Heterokaryon incompatibility domain-containing protein n=1 Tax=Mollisia scopiformis TaxID=149040 RepID=A0A132BBQ1_MOLSC|nr:uncharacterized protein LY89DRAFT_788483 [Mollisia scopiformis]KUJ09077.1 hypothetical protein LY89DRAFT_788483 [Mollisia scopiformis]